MTLLCSNRSALLLFAGLALAGSSCSVVVGNIKPVDQKSENYGVMDLSQINRDWNKLDPVQAAAEEGPREREVSSTEVSDVAYQSKSTASIISLDSACRESNGLEGQDLQTLTNLLFLGMTDMTHREERGIEIQKTPALETTIQGKLNGEPMRFRTIVLRRDRCVYDLVYMARPKFFPRHEEDFARFVASLKLK